MIAVSPSVCAWHHAWYDDGGPARGIGNGLIAYTFLNNRPSQITQHAEPVTFDERLKVNLGMYVQDQWTLRRLTPNLAESSIGCCRKSSRATPIKADRTSSAPRCRRPGSPSLSSQQ